MAVTVVSSLNGVKITLDWITASPKMGVFCKACVLFAPSNVRWQNLNKLVSNPIHTWTKQSSTFCRHEKLQYHQESMAKMVAFR